MDHSRLASDDDVDAIFDADDRYIRLLISLHLFTGKVTREDYIYTYAFENPHFRFHI